jgi:hypothetical protein
MSALDFFISQVEVLNVNTESEEYNEGYNGTVQEVHYGIRSGSIKSVRQLEEYIEQYDSFIEGYEDDKYKEGSQDAINQFNKYLQMMI